MCTFYYCHINCERECMDMIYCDFVVGKRMEIVIFDNSARTRRSNQLIYLIYIFFSNFPSKNYRGCFEEKPTNIVEKKLKHISTRLVFTNLVHFLESRNFSIFKLVLFANL